MYQDALLDSGEEVVTHIEGGLGSHPHQHTCWDDNSRFFLRASVHLLTTFFVLLILTQLCLYSITYHHITRVSPVVISPYADLMEVMALKPCVFPRHSEPLPRDVDCLADSSCPFGYSCSLVADQVSQTTKFVCLDTTRHCGDLHVCADYIDSLPSFGMALPAKRSDVEVSETFYVLGLLPLLMNLFILVAIWTIFNFATAVRGDPLLPRPPATSRLTLMIYENLDKYIPDDLPSSALCFINLVRITLSNRPMSHLPPLDHPCTFGCAYLPFRNVLPGWSHSFPPHSHRNR